MRTATVSKQISNAETVVGTAASAGTGAVVGHALLHVISGTAITACTAACAPALLLGAGVAACWYLLAVSSNN